MAGERDLLYLFGIAGHPAPSPLIAQLEAAGFNVVVPRIKGFDASWDFVAPDDYLGWLTVLWDAIDASGVRLPCPVVGASVGGMLAVDLAAYRPEAVSARCALLAPFGIFDDANQGIDLYAVPTPDRMEHLFAKGVPEPFVDRFSELGPDDGPGRALPERRRGSEPAVAARRSRPGLTPAPHPLSAAVAVGRAGRAAAARRVRALGRGRRPRRGDRRRRASPRVGRARPGRCPRRGVPHATRE